MNISLITPASKRSLSGNRATAVRWARHLRDLGHRVSIAERYDGTPADLMIAIHAWRSAESIVRFRELRPGRPIVVLLAGTDVYAFQKSDPETTHRSMELADRLVGLHEFVSRDIPSRFRRKLDVIVQSAKPVARRAPLARAFEVCVVGHLREEKDPLRAALAARRLPADSRVRVIHVGRAHDASWAKRARAEMAANPRYVWLGEVPHWRVRRLMSRAGLMVLSSRLEGGANVVSEAIAARLPVLASRIAGNVGLLGRDYDGYYPVEDDAALARLMARAETDDRFLASLRRQCRAREPLFRPARERENWRRLVAELCGGPRTAHG
jgi:putative glycosyltransferase (TIGR04348 family)